MTMRDQKPSEAAFAWMDAVRFLAAALVVLNHVRDLILVDAGQAGHLTVAAKALYFAAGFGHQSVMVFFVLSGFWISGSVKRRDSHPDFWLEYLVGRLSRLLVVLIPALLLGGVLDYLGSRFVAPDFYLPTRGAQSMPDLQHSLNLPSFMASLFFLQTLLAPPFGSNGPLWSLAYEFWFYLWWPGAWLLMTRRQLSPAIPTLALGWMFPSLAFGFLCWLTGAALFFGYEWCQRHALMGRKAIGIPLFAFAGMVLLTLLAYSRARNDPAWTDLAIASAFAVTLLGLCIWEPRRVRVLTPFASYGAGSSFSLYAIHYPAVALLIGLFAPHGRLACTPQSMLFVMTIWLVAIAVGWLFSKATEARTGKARKLLRALLSKPILHAATR